MKCMKTDLLVQSACECFGHKQNMQEVAHAFCDLCCLMVENIKHPSEG